MNRIVVHADREGPAISRHIYGQFMEHMERCVYGGTWVGPESPIPNTRGWRDDVIEALRKIEVPNIRWPGGNFAETYHWRDGIGPVDQRPTVGEESNRVGTHEFMDYCELLDCEPYICGNLLHGSVREMLDWYRYMTSDGDDPMADLRGANGRAEPWRVPFWVIGNEVMMVMTAEDFAGLFCHYADKLKPECLIACGPNHDNYDWTDAVMRLVGDRAGGLAMHYYTIPGPWKHKGSALNFPESDWFMTLKKVLFTDELLAGHSAVMDRYDPEERVGIVVDEWGTWYDGDPGVRQCWQQNSLRDALVAGVSLNIFHRHCNRVFMTNISQVVNVLQTMILIDGERMVRTPTYHVFEMYKVHHDATLLPADVTCQDYSFEDDSIPGVSASASRDSEGRIHVSLCNLDPQGDLDVVCELEGARPANVTGRIITAEAMDEHNTFDEPDRLVPGDFTGAALAGGKLAISLPAKSVIVLELT